MKLSHHRPAPRPHARPLTRRRDGGYVLAKFALLLVPLLLMTGLSVDVGYWYSRAADIQKAADAAALAGVVWLPDVPAAITNAKTAAAKNGFVDGQDDVTVTVTQAGDRRLRVVIRDQSVGSFFFLNLGGREIDMTREGLAEYVLPVPMGSPYNFFGTGGLTSSTDAELSSPTLIYQSVNPSCTSKVNGDRHQSLHYGPLSGASLTSCPSTPTNTNDYRAQGYELYIEAKKNRPASIDVLLYDPRYNPGAVNLPQQCTTTYPTNWTETTGSGTATYYATGGPAQWQTRTRTTSTTWTPTPPNVLNEGQSRSYTRSLFRYKQATTNCYTPTEPGIDSKRQNKDESFTFALYAADNTPLTDTDNPLVAGCSKTYSASTAFELTVMDSVRWNKLCTITTTMPDGRYILRVKNGNAGIQADGSNQWGMIARYTNATGDGLCDGRGTTTKALMCPRVYGKDAISVYANTQSATASFFLAEIEAEHTGKTLELELWDPGEGGDNIQFLMPTGATTWAPKNFDWVSYNDSGTQTGSGTNQPEVDVTNDKFNGQLLRIRIPLSGYAPPTGNLWWKIQYQFSATRQVTDRTTWSARVVGDPVHLLEEEAP